eukprot:TRINITY_DN6869_c0_g1_i2.p1 TRINITY_DN6869_c0_g1~~TRINITY_DN6869_c0_g1_i2.p1  ORF type:complete len:462 (+),score=78.62 TRINITY_DN6869_c0_g1_i2:65-1387(+)
MPTRLAGSATPSGRRSHLYALLFCSLPWLAPQFCSPSAWGEGEAVTGPGARRHRTRGGARVRASAVGERVNLDEATVALHKAYHDRTVEFTVENYDWVSKKSYATDEALKTSDEKQLEVWRASQDRNHRWPALHEQDLHEIPFGSDDQHFVQSRDQAERDALGDPGDNVFIISLMRRPSKLKRVLAQLHKFGMRATVVDAIDGDSFTSQEEVDNLGARTLPGYCGHKNTLPHLTSGQLGCFMSHYTIWQHMVDNNIQSALILEDDFDLQPDFQRLLGERLEEARHEDWNLMYLGRSPTEPDLRRATPHLVEPGYTLWTVAYIFRLEAAKALVEAQVQHRLAPLDHYFSIAMGKGLGGHWNENAMEWARHIPQVLKGLAITPPLIMPYAGSMFLSDTAMFRNGTKFIVDLPETGLYDTPRPGGGPLEQEWRTNKGIDDTTL